MSSDPRLGTELAGYRIVALLGRGGMSVVYRAEDLALERNIALKLLAPELAEDTRFRQRFHRESRLAASIDHPNVIPVYDAGEVGGVLYIAMRFVEGTDLRTLLLEEGPLEPARAIALVAQVADALDIAHARGLVHRDVKPSNVLISTQGDREHVYLADFGLTKSIASREELTRSGLIMGTADYVSPEQIVEGRADARSDLYSLACVFYQCLTGEVPYPKDSEFAVLWAHVNDDVPRASQRRPELPPTLDSVLEKGMAKDPEERYASARDLVQAASLALPEARAETTRASRRRVVALAASVITLVVATATVLLVRGGDESPLPPPTTEVRGPALQLIDPTTSSLVSTVTLLDAADDIAVAEDAIWVVDSSAGTITRVDPRTLEQSKTSPMPLEAEGIGTGFGGVWVTANQPRQAQPLPGIPGRKLGATLGVVDPASLSIRQIPVRVSPFVFLEEIVASEKALWLSDVASRTVERFDPKTRLGRRIEIEGVPIALAAFGADVWVAQPQTLSRIDASAGEVVAEIPLRFTPSALAADVTGLWLVDREHDLIQLFDPRARRIVSRIAVGNEPLDVAVGAGGVWVVNGAEGTVSSIDPRAKEVVAKVEVGANPVAIAVRDGRVWVAVRGETTGRLDSFPVVFAAGTGYFEVRGILPGRPGARCGRNLPVRDCFTVAAGPARAADGTEADFVWASHEKRVEGGSVRCGPEKRIYNGPVTSDVRGDGGLAIAQVQGWGTLAAHWQRHVGVFTGMVFSVEAGPICEQEAGTWVGVSGRLAGQRGIWKPPVKLPPGTLGGVALEPRG